MPFARGDMRDHIVSHKDDHGASYECYGVLQWRSRLKISFCEIFGVVQFSTFATLSARSGLSANLGAGSHIPTIDNASLPAIGDHARLASLRTLHWRAAYTIHAR